MKSEIVNVVATAGLNQEVDLKKSGNLRMFFMIPMFMARASYLVMTETLN